ncbi:Hypothetical protein ORPV_113 [Orpheovirus IHUMI-LCC2]|uniref:Uncharacterized protein n=1 Tax=Orpheovirus IHUMI-LCC2 TaxID=2023057 RepID=A0A2I2L3C5_9VIRU|nr:Hypothetical protein ORPV_113 [Orpheovirus IHUMI-LCC2]SNW62017.1 Hypothetical protein ORPV_113 [Orpheovirus IHUMI-LCC2]
MQDFSNDSQMFVGNDDVDHLNIAMDYVYNMTNNRKDRKQQKCKTDVTKREKQLNKNKRCKKEFKLRRSSPIYNKLYRLFITDHDTYDGQWLVNKYNIEHDKYGLLLVRIGDGIYQYDMGKLCDADERFSCGCIKYCDCMDDFDWGWYRD